MISRAWLLLSLFCLCAQALLAQMMTTGNLVVLEINNSGTAGSSAAVRLKEYNPNGSLMNTYAVPSTGVNRLTLAGTANSEGALTLSQDSTYIIFAGYNAVAGVANIATTSSNTNPRAVNRISKTGTIERATSSSIFGGANMRAATKGLDEDYWAAGSNTGTMYTGTATAPVIVQSAQANTRVIQIFNGELYATSQTLLFRVGSNIPRTNNNPIDTLFQFAQGSFYGFSINPKGTVAFIADDGSGGTGQSGVRKIVKSGNTWVQKYRVVTTACRGLTVDWSAADSVTGKGARVYYTTAPPSASNSLRRFTDNDTSTGGNSTPAITNIATAPDSMQFRGVCLVPKLIACTPEAIITANRDTLTPLCANQSVIFSSNVTNGGTAPAYQWFSSLTGLIAGATSAVYVAPPYSLSTGEKIYLRLISNALCAINNGKDTVYSNSISFTVKAMVTPTVAIQTTAPAKVCTQTPVVLTANPVGGGDLPALAWYVNDTTTVAGTSASFTLNTSQAGIYQVFLRLNSNETCTNTSLATATPVTITVKAPIAVDSLSLLRSVTDTAICPGTLLGFNAAVSPQPDTQLITTSWQWRVGNNVLATNSSFVTSTLPVGNLQVQVKASFSGCVVAGSVLTDSLAVRVRQPSQPTVSISRPQTICARTPVTLQASYSDVGITPGFQWYRDGQPLPGATNASITLDSITVWVPQFFQVKVTNITGTCLSSGIATSTEDSLQSIIYPYGNIRNFTPLALCPDEVCVLGLVNPALAVGDETYQWLFNGAPIAGANQHVYAAQVAGAYQMVTTSTTTGCVFTSRPRQVTVKLAGRPSIQAPATAICGNETIVLSTDSLSGYRLRWLRNGTPLGKKQFQRVNRSGDYTVRLTVKGCAPVLAPPVTIQQYGRPDLTVMADGLLEQCGTTNPVTLLAVLNPAYTYQWLRSGALIPGATQSSYVADEPGRYRVRISNGGCLPKKSITQVVRMTPMPTAVITTIHATATEANLRANLLANAAYQWYRNGQAIPDATDRFFTATQSGNYSVSITRYGCTASALPIAVNLTGAMKESAVPKDAITIYPNPSTGIFHLEGPSEVQVRITDLQGRVLLDWQQVREIDLSDMPAGVYLAELREEAGVLMKTERLILK